MDGYYLSVLYMAIRNGFQVTRILLNNIPNIQASGVWSGNNTPVTTLDKGVYFVNFNVAYACGGTGPITNSQTAICINSPFSGGGLIIASTPITGQMGMSGANTMKQTLSNTFVVTADNTPIYVYLSVTLTGPWGTVNPQDANLNIITFTRLSNL
jgi:hypothetical protein